MSTQTITRDLTTQTPVEIDTQLAAIYEREYTAQVLVRRYRDEVDTQKSYLAAKEAGRNNFYTRNASQSTLDHYQAKLDEARANYAAICDEEIPFDQEFNRRGGWTRAFLVKNNGGHVHRSMNCNTCFPTTRFGWLVQMSGHDEAEIVDLAGEGACTICYPSAPCTGPLRLELPADKAAREERAAAKAERDAKKAAKAIGPIDVTGWNGRVEIILTHAAAKAWLTDHFEATTKGWGTPKEEEDVVKVTFALVAKEGISFQEVQDAAIKRAKNRK